MPLASDLIVDDAKFDAAKISAATAALNERLIETQSSMPKWYEVWIPCFKGHTTQQDRMLNAAHRSVPRSSARCDGMERRPCQSLL